MGNYGDLVALTSQDLLSSTFWGVSYFLVLFVPLYAYTRRFISIETTPLFETIAFALVLQVGSMIAFSMIGTFIEHINIGMNSLNPSKAFPIFFGDGSQLLDERWGEYSQQFANDSFTQTQFGSEAKGVNFLLNKYIGIVYRISIVFLFLFSFYWVLAEYLKSGGLEYNVFSRLYALSIKVVSIILLIGIHSNVATTYVSYFGVDDSKATNMISSFQTVIAQIFYN